MARQVRPATETLTEKKLNLQGRVLRREFEHPLRQVTFRTANDATRATPLLIKEQGGQKVIDSPVLHRNHENMVKMWRRHPRGKSEPKLRRRQRWHEWDNLQLCVCLQEALPRKPKTTKGQTQKAKLDLKEENTSMKRFANFSQIDLNLNKKMKPLNYLDHKIKFFWLLWNVK